MFYAVTGIIIGLVISFIPASVFPLKWVYLFSLFTPIPLLWATIVEATTNMLFFGILGGIIGDVIKKRKSQKGEFPSTLN